MDQRFCLVGSTDRRLQRRRFDRQSRFALSHPAMGTILVGMATPQQFEDALAAVQKGSLPPAALERLSALQQAFAGEPR